MKSQCLFWDDKRSISDVAYILKEGNVVIGSSDTVLGLLADITKTGFDKLNTIKQRVDKPYLILIASKKNLTHFTDAQSPELERLINSCWPGPLTVIVKAKKDIPDFLCSKDGTIALRVPNHPGLLLLLKHFTGLFSTSANRTGQPIPLSIDDLDPQIRTLAASIIIDREIKKEAVQPSTIIDCSGPTIKIVREGAYPVTELEKIVGKN